MNFSGLISEDGKNVSLGRVAFWTLLLAAGHFWFAKPIAEFPPTLYSALSGVLLYNFGKGGLTTLSNYIDLKVSATKV